MFWSLLTDGLLDFIYQPSDDPNHQGQYLPTATPIPWSDVEVGGLVFAGSPSVSAAFQPTFQLRHPEFAATPFERFQPALLEFAKECIRRAGRPDN